MPMAMEGLLHVRAGDLHEALVVVVGVRRRKVLPKRPAVVSMAYDAGRRELTISEARHGARRHGVPAHGVWSGHIQTDGRRLQVLAAKYPADEGIDLMPTAKELIIVAGKSQIALPRTDWGRPAIKERPMKPDSRHRGKVEVPPDPVGKRVEWGDTWSFSARVPMPQHRPPKKGS